MKEMTFEETKLVELDILSNVAEFCDKNGLKYFLAYGTLIGAIRHKGFIPWDDDIDIWMPRDDYNKLIETYNTQNNEPYYLVSPYDSNSYHTFVKIINTKTLKIEAGVEYKNGFLGIDIDVFPLDGQPEDDAEYNKWYHKLQKQYKIYSYFFLTSKGSIKRRIGLPIIRFFSGGKKNILKKAKRLHEIYPYNECAFVGAVESCYNFKNNRYKKEWFDDYILFDFENMQFKIPIGYDKILTKMYGDYMQLPPKEKQITHHGNNVYWVGEDEKI